MRSETSSAFSLTRRRAHSLFRFRRGRCSRLSRAAASTGFRASFMAPPLSGLADMRPSPVIAAIRFRGERTSGYREWTAIVLARGKNIENRLAQLFSEPLGARFGDRRRRAARCERIVRTGQAGDANAAHSSARTPSPPQEPARQPRATRPPTVVSPTPSAKPAPQTPRPPGGDALSPPQAPPAVDTSQPPPTLPRAPREKMRACAEEWDKMKRESKDGLPMWRDFATQCLTR
ncbi:MAG: hypothetical protein FD172_213 [Methylocystaceae bacterium]|nr:MAG: hypothetical protein FD172_213 [Methylocystaceae bacterium]